MLYIALFRTDGTEPDKASGYRRIAVDAAPEDAPQLLQSRQIAFPDVTAPGYGMVAAAAVCTAETGGDTLCIRKFPEPLNVHAGVVPVIHNGRLYRGVDVKARVITQPAAQCLAGGV